MKALDFSASDSACTMPCSRSGQQQTTDSRHTASRGGVGRQRQHRHRDEHDNNRAGDTQPPRRQTTCSGRWSGEQLTIGLGTRRREERQRAGGGGQAAGKRKMGPGMRFPWRNRQGRGCGAEGTTRDAAGGRGVKGAGCTWLKLQDQPRQAAAGERRGGGPGAPRW